MSELKDKVREIQDKFLVIKTERDTKLKQLEELNKERSETLQNIDVRVRTINFVESVASSERTRVKEKVEKLITSCLHAVYDDTYSVEFDYGIKNSKTSVEIYVNRKCKNGMEVKRTIDGLGGGVADTISLPLKLIVLMNDNKFDKILIADEPGKHLDIKRIEKFASFIKEISDKLGVQIIMSSHHECMSDYADNIHKITLDDSVSRVERIK